MKKYKPGVLFGKELEALYKDAKDNNFAMPAVNTIGTNSINATLETAADLNYVRIEDLAKLGELLNKCFAMLSKMISSSSA